MGYKGKPVQWATLGGTFQSKRKALLEFKFPEFSLNKTVQRKCHVDDTTDYRTARYHDMIIGTDLLSELGMNIDFKHHLRVILNARSDPTQNVGSLLRHGQESAPFLTKSQVGLNPDRCESRTG